MVRVPSVDEEDLRRPGRERDRLTSERVGLENRVRSLLCLHGIYDFRPRLRKAEGVRTKVVGSSSGVL